MASLEVDLASTEEFRTMSVIAMIAVNALRFYGLGGNDDGTTAKDALKQIERELTAISVVVTESN